MIIWTMKLFNAAHNVDYDEDDELDDDEDDGKKFRVFWTTKSLIKNASKSNKLMHMHLTN